MIRLQTFLNLDSPDEYTAPFARLVPLLKQHGIEFNPNFGDAVFADGSSIPDGDNRPTILLDKSDSAALWWMFEPKGDRTRHLLRQDRVRGLMKIARYTDRSQYNRPATDECIHARRVRSLSNGQLPDIHYPERERLTEEELDKIILTPGFWAFDPCGIQACETVDLHEHRSLDVLCAGTVTYACPVISWHRRTALKRLAQVRGVRAFLGRGRVLPAAIYHNLLRQSKICVSPWGWGETCHRDYEALAAGCVLIKPRTDFIESMMPLGEDHYVPCKPDFSDLNDCIHEVLAKWPALRSMRESAIKLIRQARDPSRLAKQCADSIKLALLR